MFRSIMMMMEAYILMVLMLLWLAQLAPLWERSFSRHSLLVQEDLMERWLRREGGKESRVVGGGVARGRERGKEKGRERGLSVLV